MSMQQDLAKCINDTRLYISNNAANRLKPWIDYPSEQLITSIQNAIRIQKNQANGFLIHKNGGVSLEKIVLTYDDLFTDDDKRIAKQTLGL
jgi:hypothetical protein